MDRCRELSAKAQERWDDGDEETGYQLLGASSKFGKLVEEAAAVQTLEKHLLTLSRGQQESGWSAGEVAADTSHILRYTRATLPEVGVIDSYSYARAKSKQSFWVLVQYEVEGRSQF